MFSVPSATLAAAATASGERGLASARVSLTVAFVYDDHNRGVLGPEVAARAEALRADIIAGRVEVPSR